MNPSIFQLYHAIQYEADTQNTTRLCKGKNNFVVLCFPHVGSLLVLRSTLSLTSEVKGCRCKSTHIFQYNCGDYETFSFRNVKRIRRNIYYSKICKAQMCSTNIQTRMKVKLYLVTVILAFI